jgi:heptosyltransferase-2
VSSLTAMKILLIPKAFFGDIVLTSACISEIKRNNPHVEISVMLPPSAISLIEGHPDISEVIPFDRRKEGKGFAGLRRMAARIKRKRFDKAYSFQKSPRTALLLALARVPERVCTAGSKLGFLYHRKVVINEGLHEVLRIAQLVSDLLSPEQRKDAELLSQGREPRELGAFSLTLPIPVRDVMGERAMEVLRGESPYVVLVPGSAWATKRWSARGYREVCREYLHRGLRVVLVGAPSERELCEQIGADLPVSNLAGQISLPELVRIIADSAGVVCNDSMALHVASSTKTPCVAIFCATSPKFGFGPWCNNAVVVEKEGLFCKPCRRHGSNRCPVGTNACIDGVTAPRVIAALTDVMNSSKPVGSKV